MGCAYLTRRCLGRGPAPWSSGQLASRGCAACLPSVGLRTTAADCPGPRHTTVKRKVAIHLGYVGTGFRGLQFLRNSELGEAVEDVLEDALVASGSVLPSNAGHTHKLGWSRSSRTDKGVVGVKLECEEGVFARDPEGRALAATLNERLPDQVRVFSVQRVHNAFNARQQCADRSYRYHLPAAALGLTGGAADGQVLQRLAACLDLFRGTHCFHNFTERKRYRIGHRQKLRGKAQELWQANGRAPAAAASLPSNRSFSSAAAGQDSTAEAGQAGCRPALRWLSEPVEWDRVSDSHYRHISGAAAGPPAPLLPGGPACVAIRLSGASFMVHQIRHMVAAAACVATGRLPLALVEAALCEHARVGLPLAPPQGLLLADCAFHPFPTAGDRPHPATALSGPALTLRAAGQAAAAAFDREVLRPALDVELRAFDWAAWGQELDARCSFAAGEMDALLAAFNGWRAARDARRAADRSAPLPAASEQLARDEQPMPASRN